MDDLTRALLPVADRPDQVAALQLALDGFCQVMRDRLNCLRLGVYLAQRRADASSAETLRQLQHRSITVEQLLDRLQDFYRPIRLVTMPVTFGQLLAERKDQWVQWLAERGAALHWLTPHREPLTLLDPVLMVHAFDELLHWRCSRLAAGSQVSVAWGGRGGGLHWSWNERQPHVGGPATPSTPPPLSTPPRSNCALAIALLARLANLHGGRIEVGDQPGFQVSLRLPLAPELDRPRPSRIA